MGTKKKEKNARPITLVSLVDTKQPTAEENEWGKRQSIRIFRVNEMHAASGPSGAVPFFTGQ